MPSALDTTVAPTPLSGTSTRDTAASCCAAGTDWASRRVHGVTSARRLSINQQHYVKAKTVESYPLVELPPDGFDFDDAVDRSFVTTQRHFSDAEVVYMYMQREISLVGREGALANRIKCVFDEQAQHRFLDSLKQIRATLRERYSEFRGAACSEVT